MMDNKKPPRRLPHTPFTMQTIRELGALRKTPENGDVVTGLADVLALWTHYMIEANPAVAASIYRVLCDAWRDNRNGDQCPDMDSDRDRETVELHVLFLNMYFAVTDQAVRERTYPSEIAGHAAVMRYARALLANMLSRFSGASGAPPRENADQVRISELRVRLNHIEPLPENEAVRFKLETQIYQLEQADEWPEIIAA